MASSQVILRGDGFLPPPSAVSSIPSPRGFLYAWTSPHTTHCTRRTSSSYMLMMVWVVSALQRGEGQYASISPPTSSASSSKMESIPASSRTSPTANYLKDHVNPRSGVLVFDFWPLPRIQVRRQPRGPTSELGNGRIAGECVA